MVVVDNAHSSVLLVVGHGAKTGMLIIIFIITFQYGNDYDGIDNDDDGDNDDQHNLS